MSALPGTIAVGDAPAPEHGGVQLRRRLVETSNEYGSVYRVSADVVLDSRTAQGSGDDPGEGVLVSRVPTLDLALTPGEWTAYWFVSDWGDEFTPRSRRVARPLRLEVQRGRSSKGTHPWVCLVSGTGVAVVVAPAWSGNWMIEVEPDSTGAVQVRAGISDWCFGRRITRDRPMVAPEVFVAVGADRAAATASLARYASTHIVPSTEWTRRMPLEWNHWWPYEDADISHEMFVANARLARELGAEVATLDAGWFGRPDSATFWERERGDWDSENLERFPSGVAGLSDAVRAEQLQFGIWIEGEAVGLDAIVRTAHPEVLARRDDDPPEAALDPDDPGFLGYVCLGSPAGRQHVLGSVDRLVTRTGARWVKWDFNVDPWAGCSRVDHGHDAGDGLYEHYLGLYDVFDEVRRRYPDLILESCSSGGLRIDLGLLGHVHAAFLSDPDWMEFHLQLLWGAAQSVPAAAILHFTESDWRTFHPLQNFDSATADIDDIDAIMRSVLLHRFGLSYALPRWPAELRDRIREHVEIHRRLAVPLIVHHGVIRPLTEQPLREGLGHRFPAFALTSGGTSLVAVHRLEGAAPGTTIWLRDLDPALAYRVELVGPGADPGDLRGWSGDAVRTFAAGELANEGITLQPKGTARSWLLSVVPLVDGKNT